MIATGWTQDIRVILQLQMCQKYRYVIVQVANFKIQYTLNVLCQKDF